MSENNPNNSDTVEKQTEEDNPILKQATLPKRFYENVEVQEVDASSDNNKLTTEQREEISYAILLDGRTIKTPARNIVSVPSHALAELIADEFRLQKEVIDPALMPVLRLVNTVIDGIADDIQPVIEDILRYMSCDMVFYRAESPQKLVERQSQSWDQALDWAWDVMGAEFESGSGVMFHAQKPEALNAAKNYLHQWVRPETNLTPYSVAALHLMTSLTGSALLACMIDAKALSVENAWRFAYIEEDWTAEQWGEDEKAMQSRATRERDFYAAAAVLSAIKEN